MYPGMDPGFGGEGEARVGRDTPPPHPHPQLGGTGGTGGGGGVWGPALAAMQLSK